MNKRAEENEQMRNVIRCLAFFKACGMKLLSDVYIQPEVTLGNFHKLLTLGMKIRPTVRSNIIPYFRYLSYVQVELSHLGFGRIMRPKFSANFSF